LIKWSVLNHVNNQQYYPEVVGVENATSGQWYNMKGKIIITPTQNDAMLYLTNWDNEFGGLSRDIFYIANPTITITEGNFINPDFSLTPLKDIYVNHFLIGNITNADGTYLSGRHFDLLKHHFNIVTSTETFPFQLAPSSKGGTYNWAKADYSTNLMIRNNIAVFGHCLIYPDASVTPAWMTEGTREEVIQNMNDDITTVVRHFRGRINAWDVVVEALRYDGITARDARGDWRNCLNDSVQRSGIYSPKNPWFDKLGSDYIELAFRAARAADPNITLYYQDHGFEDPNRAEVVRKMIQEINDKYKRETGGTRNLIEGINSQSHITTSQARITLSTLNNAYFNNVRAGLDKLVSLGIEIAIGELDISTVGFSKGQGRDTVMSERDAIAQARAYAQLMQIYKDYSAHIKRVTFWGIDDNTSWLSSGNPTLFDWRLNAKQSFHAVSDPDGFLRQHSGGTRR